MGLKPEFEALRTQILNNTPLPSLFEAFATIEGDERRRRILSPSPMVRHPPPISDQLAFAARSGPRPPSSSRSPGATSGPPSAGNHPYCQHCRQLGHTIDCCFDLHPELKQQFPRNKVAGRGRGAPCTGAVVETNYPLPDFSQLQSQIAQLQSHLGLGTTSSSSGPTAAIAVGTPTALHGTSDHPTWILNSGANNHMTGELSNFISPFTSLR